MPEGKTVLGESSLPLRG